MKAREDHEEIYYHPLRSRTRRLGEPFDRENQMLRAFKLRSTASEIPATLSGEIQRGRGGRRRLGGTPGAYRPEAGYYMSVAPPLL